MDKSLCAAILESANDAIIATNPDNLVTAWNAAAERVFGYSAEEATGRPIDLIIPAWRSAEERSILVRIGQGEQVAPFNTACLRKDGSEINVSIGVTAILERGALAGASHIIREIGGQKPLECMDCPAAMGQRHGHEIVSHWSARGDFTYVNEKFCEICRLSSKELLGKNHRVLDSGYQSEEFFAQMWSEISQGRVWNGEILIRAGDGSIHCLDTTIVPSTGADGTPTKYMAFQTDLTGAKRTLIELEERRKRELERSNAALEAFAYVASHDLQEPLRGVSACVQVLAERYRGRIDASADELIDHAVANLQRMQVMILDLLEYSRTGRRDALGERADCNAALEAAKRNLADAIAESGASVESGALPQVEGNFAELTRLFQNLLSNSIKFRGADPPLIRVAARKVPGDFWEFTISDNGIGFPQEQAERIFRVFQRLHSRNRYPGTGIGLAIVERIVAAHGGHIWVQSQPGQGAIFHFTLSARGAAPDLHLQAAAGGDRG